MAQTNDTLFRVAQNYIPGGVNSPVRSFAAVGGHPPFIKRASGPYLIDEDDQTYLDYVGSWGPMILGHAHPDVIRAVKQACDQGLSYGAPTKLEIELAQRITQLMPAIERVRMVNSGTEATMTAIRLARGYTQRNKIIKFTGCYHGHSDGLLVQAGSGALTLGVPSSPGVPESVVAHTLTAEFNDLNQVEALFAQHPNDVAAIIVEPIAGNMGMVLPQPEFLSNLRALCDQYEALLIFDEVMTGFRVALGGAQALYDIKPDLTTLGKVIGGGLPVGALGGRQDIMSELAPSGPVYQAGTLSGNPIAMTAGIATLTQIQQPGFYQNLNERSQQLVSGLAQSAREAGIPLQVMAVGGMFGFHFNSAEKIQSYQTVKSGDHKRFNTFFQKMLAQGVYFAPSAFEAGFVSAAHTAHHIDQTIACAHKVLQQL